MDAEYVRAWLLAFAFTQLVEVPLYRYVLGCSLARAFGASALTHPVIWFVLFPLLGWDHVAKVWLAEAFAWSAETLWFARTYGLGRSAMASLSANAASFALGMLCRELFGIP